jgi:hypothetical protein
MKIKFKLNESKWLRPVWDRQTMPVYAGEFWHIVCRFLTGIVPIIIVYKL